ncbi:MULTISPECIES: PAQR family membrane homeostasis protein TrhA [unclassified Roseivivax]|uniref:PAQR family membrane homeostasis protein TrhA n=1 Tax=Roseivivax sp. GX 12232 TaxID=2900547 RepID=UPI001E2C1D4D|nr:hemolysin III family protein [Roseivivax sp. GX 12232]MCE0504740.1 hemolysin III family protein [Roseivivax sp. GX 12232]
MVRDLTYWGAALHNGPPLSFRAWLTDAIVNLAGLILALGGAAFLMGWATVSGASGPVLMALSLYAAALVASFLASLVYNSGPWHAQRPLLRRLDHAAIYIKIAGTATPFAVIVASPFALSMMSLVWVLALYGASRKLFFWWKPGRFDPFVYLGLAWFSALPMVALPGLVPQATMWLMLAGGLIYTGGVYFYMRHDWPYARALWHICVLAAASAFYAAVILGAPGRLF